MNRNEQSDQPGGTSPLNYKVFHLKKFNAFRKSPYAHEQEMDHRCQDIRTATTDSASVLHLHLA